MAAPRQLQRLTVAEALIRYTEHLQLRVAAGDMRQRTIETYLRDLTDFVAIVGADTVLDDLEATDLATALVTFGNQPDRRYSTTKKPAAPGRRVEGHGRAARARWLASVRGFFAWAARQHYVQVDPMPEVPTVQVAKRAAGSRLGLAEDRARALRDAPSSQPSPARKDQRLALRDEVILRLLMETGPRVSELCAANRDDIVADASSGNTFLHIRDGKGGKARAVPVSDQLLEVLEEYQAAERTAPPPADPTRDRDDAARALVATVRGRRLDPRDVQRMIHRHVARLPHPLRQEVTPHGLRHTAATLLLEGGANVATVAHILGHESVATTSIYLDKKDDLAAAALRNSAVVGRGRPRR